MDRLKLSPVVFDDDFRRIMVYHEINKHWLVKVNVYRCRHPKFIQAWRLFELNPDMLERITQGCVIFNSQEQLQDYFDCFPFIRFHV